MIRSLSKNSEFYKTEERRLHLVRQKVKKYLAKIEKAKQRDDWPCRDFEVSRKVAQYAREIDTTRTWIHVDMDMFYAAVATDE